MRTLSFVVLIGLFYMLGIDYLYAVQEDTTYYVVYPDKLTTRVYTSRKYTAFELKDRVSGDKMRFEPNSTLNMGIGATYNNLTLNLAYGFGFLNPDRGTGESKYLDLQAHAYPKNLVIDLFGQFYRGYYVDLSSHSFSNEPFYVSPTMRVHKFGANVQYLFNGDKISLRAAFLQNEWQKKSAGSPLLGFEIYGGNVLDEQPILPLGFLSDESRNFQRSNFFQFGPNAGYAHTFVILKHFFITGYASTNLSLGHQNLEFASGFENRWAISSNLFLRGFVGYNSEKWSVNFNYVHNRVEMVRNSSFDNTLMTGNYRINFVYRFVPGKGIRRYLDAVDLKRLL
ncbi:DUF4421 domain-containing protein [Belliella kenyensis]|uniref:DUF4421 domain-containing protein n=1 Tax=Belliella kenyensis TaxID=1472724 RepID=A0ABV8EH81_9BACT|nr:DUF4421 domain-containing protein [Belliella kenyensis]MCH7403430.1 DUF4421 domain-containing protein [Belliella kenyensis]MDN3602330.1 DUF4421 domain-containing protein [Belliella kenyensis]